MKTVLGKKRQQAAKERFNALLLDSQLNSRHLEVLSAKGCMAWLTALPLKEYGFQLNKQEFWDALALHYNWQLDAVPVTCVC